ncbi:hypothetical protein P3X46_004592 [Hevea brasiliensis]|uniref:DUF4283 domain-containing protein n=1 Tax=Hevea brasiliensis TaxID=3981 RepID=A0ABQ9MX85_HEVBR|nr:hypothetical protein P3X46_004592 [Hevea brasiliensis]
MSDPSEIVPGTSCAPTVVEQGSRRRRGKSRDPSRAREELGDLETRLAKVELHLIDGDEKIEELDTRMEELDRGMEEFREEMQGALNQAIDKIMGEGESLKISFSNEVAALREENRFLREELDRVMGKVKDMEEQMSLVRMAILQGSVVGAATTSIAPTARVEVPKPNAEMGWLKAVNSTPNLVHGVARNVKVRIGDWKGTLDFFVVSMDEYQCVLGVDFVDRVKAIPMLFANSICITEGGGTYMVPVLRGKPSPSKTLATMHMEVQKPSSTTTAVVQGKEQHGKGGGTPKSGSKECKEGNTPKLLKGHPPRRKVDCARGKSVARSPGDVASPRQGSPRQNRSRRSRWRCKAEGRAGAPSHKDEEGTEAQLEQARGNQVEHGRRHGRKSKRRGRRWD